MLPSSQSNLWEAEMPADKIRIKSAPKGEAPLWVRRQWIRCEMPVHENFYDCGHIPVYVRGVKTGNSTLQKSDGYDIAQAEALWQLERKGTKTALRALKWWRDNKFPRPNECFRFDSACAEVIKTRDHPAGTRVTVLTDMETGSFTRPM